MTCEDVLDILERLIRASFVIEERLDWRNPFAMKKLPVAPNLFGARDKKLLAEMLGNIDADSASIKEIYVKIPSGGETADILGEIGLLSLKVGQQWQGSSVRRIIPSKPGSCIVITSDGASHALEPGVTIMVGGKSTTIENVSSSMVDHSKEEILAIVKNAFTGSKIVDFASLIPAYGIKNDGELAKSFQSLIEPGAIERRSMLSTSMNPSLLLEDWFANVCGLYMPLLYHEFQARDASLLLNQFPEYSSLESIKSLLGNKFEHWEQCNAAIGIEMKEKGIKTAKPHHDEFMTRMKAIVLGGSLSNESTRPHWLSKEFRERWHARYLALDEIIMKEHFPDVLTIQPDKVSIIDPRDGVYKQIDLKVELGQHYESIKHLFTRPFYTYKVISTHMSWMTTNPKELYDGVTVTKDTGNEVSTSNDATVTFKQRFISRYIAIHPIELLCADYFGWVDLVKQTVHHEIVHRLQEKYVQCFMSIAALEGKLRDTPSKHSYTFLEAIKKDVDVKLLIELIKTTMGKLYIRETIPPEEQAKYNLEDRVRLHGGHTKAFSQVVMGFNRCEAAMKQRKAFIGLVLGHVIYRAYGVSLGSGFSWICAKTKKLGD